MNVILHLIYILLSVVGIAILFLYLERKLRKCPNCGSKSWDVKIEKINHKGIRMPAEFLICKKCGTKIFNHTI